MAKNKAIQKHLYTLNQTLLLDQMLRSQEFLQASKHRYYWSTRTRTKEIDDVEDYAKSYLNILETIANLVLNKQWGRNLAKDIFLLQYKIVENKKWIELIYQCDYSSTIILAKEWGYTPLLKDS